MKSLVKVMNGEPRTSSDLVAKEFGIAHNEMLRKIDGFSVDLIPVKFDSMYQEDQRAVRGRSFRNYSMSKRGYMYVVMNILSKKASDKKLAIIDQFEAMEQALLKQQANKGSLDWQKAREQSKAIRHDTTDVIKQFVDYATDQGSKSAKFYYKHITNATYSALHLIQHKQPKLRDTLDALELAQLMIAESVAKKALVKYMDHGEHYKAIFVLVKQDLEALSGSMMIGVSK